MYTTNNFLYLRINKTKVLPLNLLLAKEDLEWFNDHTFQEILSILKPLIIGRIELYDQGHVIKRTIAPTTYNNVYQDVDDGLEDAGVILGGSSTAQGSEDTSTIGASGKGRRWKAGPGGAKLSDKPQFTVRFGMRSSTSSERGGAILISDKNLGFLKVKKEQEDDSVLKERANRRVSMDLASLEGERGIRAELDDNVVIREEDESDSMRVSNFPRGEVDAVDDVEGRANEDVDYDDAKSSGRGSKRKQSARTGSGHNGKGKRAKADDVELSSSQADHKPTLQITYGALNLHPQTLYIVVRTLGPSETPAATILSFTVPVDEAATSPSSVVQPNRGVSSSEPKDRVPSEQVEEEDSLFPPGMDYFMS
ncbi:hypothetical protein EDD11_009289 [Mortierella claussenii]|nr:hypothetical protein EDD11_009289 [Mortierella claussenii]